MKGETLLTITVLCLIFFFLGLFTRSTPFIVSRTETVTREVLVSERKAECEKQGGHYSLWYADWTTDGVYHGEYQDSCDLENAVIFSGVYEGG